MKTLISWIATNNDFHGEEAAEDSPNLNVHEHYYADHMRHIILSSLKENPTSDNSLKDRQMFRQTQSLLTAIQKRCPSHKVEIRYLGIENVIDIEEIFAKVETVMTELRGDEIEIFFSPGTSIMQVVWFIFHMDQNYTTRLIQGVRKEFNDGIVPRFFVTEVKESLFRRDLLVKNAVLESRERSWDDPVITPSIRGIYENARMIGSVDKIPCLITGPSGAGKELLARYLFKHSVRATKEFITVNTGAVPDTLLHSMLFGYKKGSFTGADKDHKGYFEEADKGTVFLDEIGDIGPQMQLSLLRFLQQGEIQPLGTAIPRKVDVRVIAATNADLKKRCQDGKFRWDLYYRLARTRLHLPGLIDRSADEVARLTAYFLERFADEFRKPLLVLTKDALARIQEHNWPGNVRELENLIINLYVFCQGRAEDADVKEALDYIGEEGGFRLEAAMQRHVEKVNHYFGGNKARAASALGVSRNTLYKYLGQGGDAPESL